MVFVIARTGGFLPLYAWWAYKVLFNCNGIPLFHRCAALMNLLLLVPPPRVCWLACVGVGVAGSQMWSWKLVKGFTKHWSAAKKVQ